MSHQQQRAAEILMGKTISQKRNGIVKTGNWHANDTKRKRNFVFQKKKLKKCGAEKTLSLSKLFVVFTGNPTKEFVMKGLLRI